MEMDFCRAELKEIEIHKYFLSLHRGYDVGLDAAKQDWVEHHSQSWRQKRHEHMLALQREEISRYKWIESEKANCDLGRKACLDWIAKYAAQWRDWFEHEHEGSGAA
jgi:hypothetical protein